MINFEVSHTFPRFHSSTASKDSLVSQVVVASGDILNANANRNPDLFKALKGGSNNFGIVTRFDMKAFEQGPFWGGVIAHPFSAREDLFQAFEKFALLQRDDPYAALINSFVWTPAGWVIVNNVEYTKPKAYPRVFEPITDLPQLFDTMRIDTHSHFSVELGLFALSGRRQLFATLTHVNSAAFMERFFQLADKSIKSLKLVPGLGFYLSFQPQGQVIISKSGAGAGTNSLGLDSSDGELVVALVNVVWDLSVFDWVVNRRVQELMGKAARIAEEMGVLNEYVYLNYAAPWQRPISGYGVQSRNELLETSRRYDPGQLFQKAVPGGFKLTSD